MSERLKHVLTGFLEDRPAMRANNTPENILTMLAGELVEATQAIERGQETDIRDEVADLIILGYTLAIQLGLDPEEIALEKSALNHLKLPAHMFGEDADYHEAYLLSRQIKKRDQIAKRFYE